VGARALLPLALLALLAAGCARGNAESARRLRVGFFPNVTHAVALVGIESGRFARALGPGVRLDPRPFAAGTELVTAIAAGEIDLAYIGPGPTITGYVAGVPIRVLAGAAEGGSVLVSRGDLTIESPAALSGRRVSIPAYGNTQDVLLRGILARFGLRDTTRGGSVEVVRVESADVRLLFEQKQLDAALLPEPWAARVEVEARARVVLDWREVWREGRYPSALLVATDALLRERPDVADAWLAVHREIVAWIRAQPEEARQAIDTALFHHTRKRLPPGVLERAIARMQITDELRGDPPPVLAEFAAMMRDARYLRGSRSLAGLVRP
jgi:NitT/TauT family transport system substrate-binding protein